MKKYIILLLVMLCAASCVYPFEPEISGDKHLLVIEGDVLIGATSTIKLSYMAFMGEDRIEPLYESTVKVQSGDGTEYAAGYDFKTREYSVNLRDADPSKEYRLYAKLRDGREYVSEWMKPRMAPVVDDVTYELDASTNRVMFNISLHSNDNEQYFRWYFDETWEYRALYRALAEYTPVSETDPQYEKYPYGIMMFYEKCVGNYQCWSRYSSRDLHFTTTKELQTNTVTEKNFYRVDAQNPRMSVLYCMEVYVESLSRDCYDYWKTMSTNSDNVGDLFSPVPSEVRGNIRCLSDSTELVLGYINVSEVGQKRIYVDNTETGYYKKGPRTDEEVMAVVPQEEWRKYYLNKRYLPVQKGEGPDVYWAPARCVDCTLAGGTTGRPPFWPNEQM